MILIDERDLQAVKLAVDVSKNASSAALQIIGHCADRVHEPIWDLLRLIDYNLDMQRLNASMYRLLICYPPPLTVSGFWFGLANNASPGEEGAFDLYLSGSSQYDISDPNAEWAVNPDYYPPENRLGSTALALICRRLRESSPDARSIGEYAVSLGYAAAAVKELCNLAHIRPLIQGVRLRPVFVGFDSGDFLEVDAISPRPS